MLSDIITKLAQTNTKLLSDELEKEFINNQLGLYIEGMPIGKPGNKILADGKLKFYPVSDPKGNLLLKACADPDVFRKNYNENINALMTGREILEMIAKVPNLSGVLICSATSFNSYALYKDRIKVILEESKT